jgi:hypothetical protein
MDSMSSTPCSLILEDRVACGGVLEAKNATGAKGGQAIPSSTLLLHLFLSLHL